MQLFLVQEKAVKRLKRGNDGIGTFLSWIVTQSNISSQRDYPFF